MEKRGDQSSDSVKGDLQGVIERTFTLYYDPPLGGSQWREEKERLNHFTRAVTRTISSAEEPRGENSGASRKP